MAKRKRSAKKKATRKASGRKITKRKITKRKSTRKGFTPSRVIEKRVLLTPREVRRFTSIMGDLTRAAGCKVSFADIVRCSLNLLEDGHRTMAKEIRKEAPLSRPVNGDIPGAVAYEKRLTGYLRRGLKMRS